MVALRMGREESDMSARPAHQIAAAASGATMRDVCTNAAVLLLCAALVTLAMTAFLLLTLPDVLDTVATNMADAPRAGERHPGQVVADWIDAVSDAELAIWRVRSSD